MRDVQVLGAGGRRDAAQIAVDPLPQRLVVRRIEQILGAPIDMISVGPERDQAIQVRPIFA